MKRIALVGLLTVSLFVDLVLVACNEESPLASRKEDTPEGNVIIDPFDNRFTIIALTHGVDVGDYDQVTKILVFHDNTRAVTCWLAQGPRYSTLSLSCIPDSQLPKPSPY